ncbi:hypothetical protein [Nostoc sp.]
MKTAVSFVAGSKSPLQNLRLVSCRRLKPTEFVNSMCDLFLSPQVASYSLQRSLSNPT